jgi:hypothetical protein
MSEREIAKDIRVRSSSVGLWSGVLAGPIAFAIDLQLRYALVPWACERGRTWLLTTISIPLFLVSATGALLCRSGLKASGDPPSQRARFMFLGGLMLSAGCAIAIIAMTIPDFFLRPCE